MEHRMISLLYLFSMHIMLVKIPIYKMPLSVRIDTISNLSNFLGMVRIGLNKYNFATIKIRLTLDCSSTNTA